MTRSDLLGLAIILVAAVSWLSRWEGGVFVDPAPEPGPRVVLLLEQDAHRKQHPEFVRLVMDADTRRSLEGRGHTYRLLDEDVTAPDYEWARELSDTRPWLVIATEEREVLYSGPVPTPLESLLETVREHGG